MKLSLGEAVLVSVSMGLVILLCRALPFILFRFRKKRPEQDRSILLSFVEYTVPPVAMTVLALYALGSAFSESAVRGGAELVSALLCAALHVWKRNALLSIVGGTAVYMILLRIIMQ